MSQPSFTDPRLRRLSSYYRIGVRGALPHPTNSRGTLRRSFRCRRCTYRYVMPGDRAVSGAKEAELLEHALSHPETRR